ncbi:transposase [Candidatus Tisiphia endosymbiont of Nedyus quadrimaculatus]|uniref:transposase n=1 Tax=Candidatus Tisiphia endosymbiont of Nedyus quadrimaculatus TaxID=3139332 RepID=UPI00345E16B8
MEASAEKRSEYLEKVSKYDKEQMVYLDESGIDRTICQDRGWGKIGELLVGQKSGKQYQRTNIIAGLVNNKPIAPFVFNGTCNTELFNNWVEKFLIKELKAGQVVVYSMKIKNCVVVFRDLRCSRTKCTLRSSTL